MTREIDIKTIENYTQRDWQQWVYVTVGRRRHPLTGGWEMAYRGVATLVTKSWYNDGVTVHFAFGDYPQYTFGEEFRVSVKPISSAVSWASVFEKGKGAK